MKCNTKYIYILDLLGIDDLCERYIEDVGATITCNHTVHVMKNEVVAIRDELIIGYYI